MAQLMLPTTPKSLVATALARLAKVASAVSPHLALIRESSARLIFNMPKAELLITVDKEPRMAIAMVRVLAMAMAAGQT